MDLRHRGSGHGIGVEVVEHLVRHELLRQHLQDLGLRHRPSTLLQDLQLGGDLGRQQVGPGRQELPELDEDAAGPFERGPEGFGVPPPAAHQPGPGEDHPQFGVPSQPPGPDSQGARAHGLDGTKTQVAAHPPGGGPSPTTTAAGPAPPGR